MNRQHIRAMLIAAACAGSLYISWFSLAVLAFGGMPLHIASFSAWLYDRFLIAILVFPLCIFGLLARPRWSTIPLWLCCLWITLQPFFLSTENASKWGYLLGFAGQHRALETVCVMMLPVLTQWASIARTRSESKLRSHIAI